MAVFTLFPNGLDSVLERIGEYVAPMDKKLGFKVYFIAEELLTNIIKYADFGEKEPEALLEISQKQGKVVIECRDNAKKFDTSAHRAKKPSEPLEQIELGGLGLHLVKEYANSFAYNYKDNHNITRITL